MSSKASSSVEIGPPTEDAVRFLSCLFAPYAGHVGLRCEIRCLPAPAPRQWHPLNALGLESAAKNAVLWGSQFNVYVGVLPRVGRGGGQADVSCACFLYADLDGGDEGPEGAWCILDSSLQSGLPEPNLIVGSGGGLHAYWRLLHIFEIHTPTDRLIFKMLLQRLSRKIGGQLPLAHADPAAAEIARILRVPGTLNRKQIDNPRPVTLLHVSDETSCKSIEWWDAFLPRLSPAPSRVARSLSPGEIRALPSATQALLQTAVPIGQRHRALIRLLSSARYCGYDASALTIFADQFCALNDFDERECAQVLAWTERKIMR